MKEPYNDTDSYLKDCQKLNDMVIDAIDEFSEIASEDPKTAKALIVAPVLFALIADHFEWHFYKDKSDIKKYVKHFEGILNDFVKMHHGRKKKENTGVGLGNIVIDDVRAES
tara:strand:- start:1574 stop:1909 length:336 start_codon:yes stop_codon:yes gene_type:complete